MKKLTTLIILLAIFVVIVAVSYNLMEKVDGKPLDQKRDVIWLLNHGDDGHGFDSSVLTQRKDVVSGQEVPIIDGAFSNVNGNSIVVKRLSKGDYVGNNCFALYSINDLRPLCGVADLSPFRPCLNNFIGVEDVTLKHVSDNFEAVYTLISKWGSKQQPNKSFNVNSPDNPISASEHQYGVQGYANKERSCWVESVKSDVLSRD